MRIEIYKCLVSHIFPTLGKIAQNNLRNSQQCGNIFQAIFVQYIGVFVSPEWYIEFTFAVHPEQAVVTGPVEKDKLGCSFDPVETVFLKVKSWQVIIQ